MFAMATSTKKLDKTEWLKVPDTVVGVSCVTAILGLNPYRTPLDVWEDKTGRKEIDTAEPSEAAYWGSMMENTVAKEFEARANRKVQRVNYLLRSGENGWQIANIDRAIVNPDIAGNVRVVKPEQFSQTGSMLTTDIALECKTASQFNADQWGESQLDEILEGKITSEHKIPVYYETQVQWYMAVTGLKAFALAVLLGGNNYRVYWIERDQELIDLIVARCKEFWTEYVLKDVPPPPVNVADVNKLYKQDNGNLREATTEELGIYTELKALKGQIKELETREKECQNGLIKAIGESQGLLIDGKKACTYKTQESKRFSSADFKKEYPDMYEEFSKVSTTRVFRIS